jgi:RND family efflux transporter MFP subunit
MKKILLALGILLFLAVAIWWWRKPGDVSEADDVKPVATVQVAPATRESIGRALIAYGTVDSSADGEATVTLAYDCVVQTVIARPGARVALGELLLVVEPTPDAQLQLDSARGVAAATTSSLGAVRQRYDLRLATDDDLRAAEQAALDARLKLESLDKRSQGRLTAPVAGIIVKLDAQPGATVPAGTALATIAASNRLEARLGLEPSDATVVQAGQPVTLIAINRPDAAPVKSTVGAVGAVADAGTGSIEARVRLPENSGWFPGERVQAEIEVERRTALVVPRSAVLPDDNAEVLYTVQAGKARKHSVQVGIAEGEKIEITTPDLKAGDTVVIQGNYELTDGMEVQVGDQGKAEEDKAEAKP